MALRKANTLSVVALSVAITAASIFGIVSLTSDASARIYTWEPGVQSPGYPEGYGMYPANPETVRSAEYGRMLGSRYVDTGGVLDRHGIRTRAWTDQGLYHEAAPLHMRNEEGGRLHQWEPGVVNPYAEGRMYGEGVLLPPSNAVMNAERGRMLSETYRGSEADPLYQHGVRPRSTFPAEGASSTNFRYQEVDVDHMSEKGLSK